MKLWRFRFRVCFDHPVTDPITAQMEDRKSIVVSTEVDYNHVQDHFSTFGPIKRFVHKNSVYEIEYKVMPSVRRAIENSDLYTYRIWPKAPLPVYAKSSGRYNS